ncbi:MAG: MBL fold metallo-hydrolase [Phycisphaerales bacterium JB052]
MSDAQHETAGSPVIQVFALGGFQTNCMIVTDGPTEPGKPCLIVDCGYEPEPMLDAIELQGLKPERVVLTHAHADHIAGLLSLHQRFGPIPIAMHQAEEAWLSDPMLNLSAALGLSVTAPQPAAFLKEGDQVTIGSVVFDIRETPGHSPGGLSLIHQDSNTAIVGDSLFNGSIGRTDFPGSSFETLSDSIRSKLYTLAPQTTVYPGHGPTTTIGHEMVTNPFVPAQ